METKTYDNEMILRRARRADAAYRFWTSFGVPLTLLLVAFLFSLFAPHFLSYANLTNIIRQNAILAIIAAGTTMIIIGGGIDLSMGAVVGLATVVTIKPMVSWGWPIPLAILLGLAIGLIVGLCNGVLAQKLHIPALVATLGTMLMARGGAYVFTNSEVQYAAGILPKWYLYLGSGSVGIIPIQVFMLAIVYGIGVFVMKATAFGMHAYAMGSNERSARLAGIPVDRHRIVLYGVGGLLSAVGGILLTARLTAGFAGDGLNYEFTIIAAVLLAGTSIFGGRGEVARTLIGVFFIGIITNGMDLMNVNTFWQMIATGGVLIFALFLDRLRASYLEVGS